MSDIKSLGVRAISPQVKRSEREGTKVFQRNFSDFNVWPVASSLGRIVFV